MADIAHSSPKFEADLQPADFKKWHAMFFSQFWERRQTHIHSAGWKC